MRIALLEYVCSSDLLQRLSSPQPSPPQLELADAPAYAPPAADSLANLAEEGFGMLLSLAEDLVACGHETLTLLSPQASRNLGARATKSGCTVLELQLEPTCTATWMQQWCQLAAECDDVLLIAPDEELAGIVEAFEARGIRPRNASSRFISSTADKYETACRFQQSAANSPRLLPRSYLTARSHPATKLLSDAREYGATMLRSTGFATGSVVLKDRFGVGCLGATRFESIDELLAFAEPERFDPNENEPSSQQLKSLPSNRASVSGFGTNQIVQPWIDGLPISLSCIQSTTGTICFLGAMVQKISVQANIKGTTAEPGASISYEGGWGPVLTEHSSLLKDWCTSLLELFPGGQGWVGIDAVISGGLEGELDLLSQEELLEKLVFIEINPRLTSSYLGFREVYGPELSEICLGMREAPDRLAGGADALLNTTDWITGAPAARD